MLDYLIDKAVNYFAKHMNKDVERALEENEEIRQRCRLFDDTYFNNYSFLPDLSDFLTQSSKKDLNK